MQKPKVNSKGQHKISLAFIALGILVLLIIIGAILNFLASLSQPINKNFAASPNFYWDGKSSINIITADLKNASTRQVNVISLHPKDGNAVILHLSNQIYLNVPRGYGNWELGSIYKLGQEEKPPIGAKLLQLSISNLLGVPIDGILLSKNSKFFDDPENLISNLRRNPFMPLTLFPSIETNLTPLDTVNLFWYLSKVRADKVISLDLAKSSITDSKLLPDSSRVLGVDTSKLDYFTRKNMADEVISDEGEAIAIFNGTLHPGLAQQATRMITNIGGNVVTIGSSEEKVRKTKIVLKNSEKGTSLTSGRLMHIFAPNCLREKCQTQDSKVLNSRASINIILGEDYFNFWNER